MIILLVARDIAVITLIVVAIVLFFFIPVPNYLIATICLITSIVLSIVTRRYV